MLVDILMRWFLLKISLNWHNLYADIDHYSSFQFWIKISHFVMPNLWSIIVWKYIYTIYIYIYIYETIIIIMVVLYYDTYIYIYLPYTYTILWCSHIYHIADIYIYILPTTHILCYPYASHLAYIHTIYLIPLEARSYHGSVLWTTNQYSGPTAFQG